MREIDVLIIGSGIAALQAAAKLDEKLNVTLLTKGEVRSSNTYKAQGGIAAAVGDDDNTWLHCQDSIDAGAGHCDKDAVFSLTKEGPRLVAELQKDGCHFDFNQAGKLELGLEGAHRKKRILHSGGDATGRVLAEHLLSKLNSNITVYEHTFVFELIQDKAGRCIGVKARTEDGRVVDFFAAYTIIATGGGGQLYSCTSNSSGATGDGIALAYIAGADLADLEFIQFHPTLLFQDGKACGLVSEAVRGQGGRLVNETGASLLEKKHPLGDLAPRHIVSAEIYASIMAGKSVFLNIKNISRFEEKFPTVTDLCKKSGLLLEAGRIPVAPGCHFFMGGILTDNVGRTSIKGLLAVGEVACTGVHGANRLASNSLLEGLVYGERVADFINESLKGKEVPNRTLAVSKSVNPKTGLALPERRELQERMMENTGIIRTQENLEKNLQWIRSFQLDHWLTADLAALSSKEIENLFLLLVGEMVTDAALKREESRGGHFRADFPVASEDWEGKRIIHNRYKRQKGETMNEFAETPFNARTVSS
ncbi:L-aspartate oxidase [Bacillus massilinigeriensis]|uniref:L-aspartate oxidase n=1 Tax=Bacillus mediterraneensis TaxID=1805474 RepID=UPI0008F80545|nr:L-aspartate oxidase [Bacillus mediterraneensis]